MGGNNAQHALKHDWVHEAFEKEPSKNGQSTPFARCIYYKDSKNPPPFARTWNTTIMENHLNKCTPYLQWKEHQKNQRTMGLPDNKKQKKLAFHSSGTPASSKHKLDTLFGMAVFTSCSSFHQFETPEWQEFFKALGYTPPHRNTLSSTILDRCYDTTKTQVTEIINTSSNISIVADESTNISGTRIENISVIVKGTSYFWSNESLEDKNATANATVQSIKQKALDITQGDLKRLGSLSTDTCSTQQASWAKLKLDPDLVHVFGIGCDSHGIQLIIKDIVEPGKEAKVQISSKLHDFWLDFQSIISYFGHKSTLQLGILRQKQMATLNKTIALITAGNTRWGTQVGLENWPQLNNLPN
jgi:hypothetical protein